MKLVDMTCPHCGAVIKADQEQKECSCEFCGARFAMAEDTVHIKHDDMEDAGYQFEKGRQRARQEAKKKNEPATVIVMEKAEQKTPKKRKTWLWVLGWIFIFPVPLTILMLRDNGIDKRIRYAIIAVAWVVYLIIGMSTDGKYQNADSSNQEGESAAIEQQAQQENETNDGAQTEETNHIDTFVANFNAASDTPIVDLVSFNPQDKESGYYRTEYRLNSWNDSIGQAGHIGDMEIEMTTFNSGEELRVYLHGSKTDVLAVFPYVVKAMDSSVSDEEIADVLESVDAIGDSNGFVIGEMEPGTLLGTDGDFELMADISYH